MAILFTQADGMDQHFDTYEEFEKAMILMKRLNGEEVPQDLLDEAKAKYGDKETEPFKVQIDGENFESAVKEATREFAEALDEIAKDRTPVSDEAEIPEKEPKFEVGDKVKVVENKSYGHAVGSVGEIVGVNHIKEENRWSYVVRTDKVFGNYHHKETDLELSVDEIKVGDKVKVVSSEDGTEMPYHYHDVGSVGKVVSTQKFGRIEVEVDGETQYLLPNHYEKAEPIGKDANGEDLYKGDVVTGTEDNDYAYTNSTVDMEVWGEGSSFIDEEANILVRILGESGTYGVDSSKFIKLTDNPDEEENEFKVGDKVKVVGNSHGHSVGIGAVREIKDVDSEEPKYNLSDLRFGQWAGTSDIELVQSSTKFRTGDIVRVTEEFEDHFGDRAKRGAVYSYDENVGFAEPFVGTVFLGDNIDKLVLVCRDEDRLDI